MTSSKVQIDIANKYDRVVVLVDMDCFYCQVEEKLNPELKGKPIAVVQYNAWRGGGIIAVNYPARAQGVTRHMRGDEAKENCPEIELVRVPNVREKADLTKYREAGKEVACVLQTFTNLLERASVDEAYLDITDKVNERLNTMNEGAFQLKPTELVNTYAVGYDNIGQYVQEISKRIETDDDDFDSQEEDKPAVRRSDIKLLIGASIVSEIRRRVKEKTGYECSAGIAHNKILAKLACGINKPNKQTLLPLRQIYALFSTMPIGKIKGLGGKFGEDVCEKLKVKFLNDLLAFSEKELQRKFDERNGSWLYLISRGIDLEAVTPRFYSKSIGCCKKFPGMNAITGLATLNHWLTELSNEIYDRLDKDIIENNRRAKQMVISFIQEINGEEISSSRSTNLISYEPEFIANEAFEVLKRNTDQFFKPNNHQAINNPIKFLGISAGKFESLETGQNTLHKMFQNQLKKKELENDKPKDVVQPSDLDATKVKETESLQKGKIIDETAAKKSFFANHFKKNSVNKASEIRAEDDVTNNKASNAENDSSEIGHQHSETEHSNPVPGKSFFLNASKSFASKTSPEPAKQTSSDAENVKTPTKDLCPVPGKSFFLNASKSFASKTSPEPAKQTSSDAENVKTPTKDSTSFLNDKNNESVVNESHYESSYAEFIVPEPSPADYVKCEKCGTTVLTYTLQSHMDFHFAFELSQMQREEFRNEMKSKLVSPPPAKRQKHSTDRKTVASKTANETGFLKKFLLKASQDTMDSSTPSTSTDVIERDKCKECGCMIEVSRMLEHMDYHTAKKLQAEINRPPTLVNSPSPGSAKKQVKNNVKSKSIANFFVNHRNC